MLWKMKVGIIFGHTSKENIEGAIVFGATVKTMEVLLGEGFGSFDGAVCPKTIENKTITVFD